MLCQQVWTGPDTFHYDGPDGHGSETIVFKTMWLFDSTDDRGSLLRFFLMRRAETAAHPDPLDHSLSGRGGDPITVAVLWVRATERQAIRDYVARCALPTLLERLPYVRSIGYCFSYMLHGSEVEEPQSLEAIRSAHRELIAMCSSGSIGHRARDSQQRSRREML